MPRPRSVTHTEIATAALAVADRDGLDALSMRTVARELGFSTMALYRYVTDRGHLERLMVEAVLGELPLAVPHGSWLERVSVLVSRLYAAAAAHPATVPLLVAHRHTVPSSLRWIEAMLGVLTEAGFTGSGRVLAQRTIMNFLLGALQSERFGSLAGPGTAAMAELPPGEYPHLSDTAGEARRVSPLEEFHGGLDAVLRGLAELYRSSA
ncbi:TetR/AcrR family transcriptional regulator [Amycolatopsis aidingensis]|uniref:TetR/AcrR family transcriptional regulator n=1 Tax=Amycolatopsis aidingensis TaxID=2842453 RepID=UPI001C0A97A5|nr:TetR/AcrR family transcriptional regulator C-terminal domain-containing protein [Amycolatopsis aidingensis]